MINKEEFDKEVERIKEEIINEKKVCPICKNGFEKKKHSYAQKYCSEECRIIGNKAVSRIGSRTNRKEKSEKSILNSRIKHNTKNPQCSFCQSGRCVRKAVKFQGFNFYPSGQRCQFNPRNKCPSFKPRYPDVYDFLKNKLKVKW